MGWVWYLLILISLEGIASKLKDIRDELRRMRNENRR